jgi:hypothetical protein
MSCFCRNRETTSGPNVNETPRSFSLHPVISLSGSDHRRSQRRPVSGTSVGRITRRICSIDWRSGLCLSASPNGERRVTKLRRREVTKAELNPCKRGGRTRPPCMVKIFSSIIAAIGRQLKQSVKVFHNLMLYRRLPIIVSS